MSFEETNLTHCLIQGKNKRVPLFENFGIHDSQNVVIDVGTSQFERVDFVILVLNYLDKLVDLTLVGLAPQFELLLSELQHLSAKFMNALVQIFEGENNAGT